MVAAVQTTIKAKLEDLKSKALRKDNYKSTKVLGSVKNRQKFIAKEGKNVGKWWGLRNLGNTCYLNAVLQCLHACTLLREIIINAPEIDWTGSRLTRRMQVAFMVMRNREKEKPWEPEEIFKEMCT